MTMSRRIAGVLLGAGLALIAPAAGAQTYLDEPAPIATAGAYVHDGSGMTLPPAVGTWRRLDVYRYDEEATDVSASYRLELGGGSVLASVYVYPMPGGPAAASTARAKACRAEFETRKSEVVAYYDDVRVLDEAEAPPPQGGAFEPGHWASFDYETEVNGRDQPVFSELYVFCFVGGPWAFEYRITRPAGLDATKAVAAFMLGLAWTVEPGL